MSVYDERYEVHYGYCSYYTSDPAKAAAVLEEHADLGNLWCNEGYGDYDYTYASRHGGSDEDGYMVTRRTIGPVSLIELQYRAQKAAVRQMIERLRT